VALELNAASQQTFSLKWVFVLGADDHFFFLRIPVSNFNVGWAFQAASGFSSQGCVPNAFFVDVQILPFCIWN
jgi:hypothetical protein